METFKQLLWYAPEYFDKWRVFPRIFITVYIYLLYDIVQWFMSVPEPNTQQAALVSTIVGVGAAWFGLYLQGKPTVHSNSGGPQIFEKISMSTSANGVTSSTIEDTRN